MKTRIAGLLAVLAASSGLSVPAWAQSAAAPIRPGERVPGVLSSTDPHLSDGRPFRAYRFDADSGRRYSVRLHSADFGPYLQVGRMVGGVTDYVAVDDGTRGGTDAVARFRPTRPGSYAVVVTTTAATAAKGGAFSLELTAIADRPPVRRVIAIGDSAAGSLDEESPTWENLGFPYDLYTFRARKGQALTLRLRMNSAAADVSVGRFDEKNAFVALSGSGVSLFRRFTPAEDGEYTIKVIAVRPDAYVLHLYERRPEQARVVVPGKVATDMLDPKIGNEAKPYHDWTLAARGGERLAISLRSSDFDTYLILNRRQGDNLARIAVNDDAPTEGRNSRIATTAPAAGEYVIRVQSADSTGGAYSLRVDTLARIVQHLRRDQIVAGQEAPGKLAETDSTLEDGSPYQEWIYRAKAAKERVMFTMRSSQFDTFLSVGRIESGKFVEFSSNDDAPGDTVGNHVSQVLIVAPAAGEFVVRANSMAVLDTGAYTLRAGPPEVEQRVAQRTNAAVSMATRAAALASDRITGVNDQGAQLRLTEAIAKMDSALSIDSSRVTQFNLNTVCWYGSLRSLATRVVRYCERAVRLAPSNTGIMDSRGVARALSGNVPGAIQDFRAFAADNTNGAVSRDQRRAWADALQSGTPPEQIFTGKLRTELLKQ